MKLQLFTDDLCAVEEHGWTVPWGEDIQDEEGNMVENTEILGMMTVKVNLLEDWRRKLDELFEMLEKYERDDMEKVKGQRESNTKPEGKGQPESTTKPEEKG